MSELVFPSHGIFRAAELNLPMMFYRIFVCVNEDKHIQIFSDTRHRCLPLSLPSLCPISVFSVVFIEEIDELVLAGSGVLQPLKLKLGSK